MWARVRVREQKKKRSELIIQAKELQGDQMCHYLRKTMVKLVCVRTTKKGRLRRMAFNNKQGIILV